MIKQKTDEKVEKFITMYLSGVPIRQIAKELQIGSRQTLYDWLEDPKIQAELDRRRQELKDAGTEYLKSKYLQCLKKIYELAKQKDDKRTSLAANQFIVEKLDGKATASLKVDANNEDNINITLVNDDDN